MALEVDFDNNITSLYKAITASDWDQAIRAVKKTPNEAKTWVVRKDEDDPTQNRWRFLPIHSACARQPPANLISALLAAFPEGARSVDDQGMYALHYASGNQASKEVIRALLMAFPAAAKLVDPRGMLPIHYVARWGPSTISVVDMILVANRTVADCEDEEGNTPLDLAKNANYPERNAVVAALKRWSISSSNGGSRINQSLGSKTTTSHKTAGSNSNTSQIDPEEKKIDDYDGMSSITPGTVGKMRDIDDQISVMEIEKKEDKLEISMLQYELKQRNEMIERLKRSLSALSDECNGLRQTLADVTEQHDGLAAMNSSLLAMVEQQEVILNATKVREEKWAKSAASRRAKLKELMKIEDEDVSYDSEFGTTLTQQTKSMAIIKESISTLNIGR